MSLLQKKTQEEISAILKEKSQDSEFIVINDNQPNKTDTSTTNATAEFWTSCKNWAQNCYQRSAEYMGRLVPPSAEEQPPFVPEAVVDEAAEGDAVDMMEEEGTIPKAYRNAAILLLSLVLVFPVLIDVYHTLLGYVHGEGSGSSSGFPSMVWKYLKSLMPSK